jgi:hypothetical protein
VINLPIIESAHRAIKVSGNEFHFPARFYQSSSALVAASAAIWDYDIAAHLMNRRDNLNA